MIGKFFTILTIFVIFILSLGCAAESNNSPEYYRQPSVFMYNSGGNNEISQPREFKAQLKEFYEFSQEFFAIWFYHIEDIELLLKKFNNENIPPDEKIVYAAKLREKYERFRDDLIQISPPPEASKAYQHALDAISKRILFFEKLEQGAGIDILTEIENEAYHSESLFWKEMDKIYEYLDQRAEKLGISNNYEGLEWI